MTEPRLEHSIFGEDDRAEESDPSSVPVSRSARREHERRGGRGGAGGGRRRGPGRLIVLVLAVCVLVGGGYFAFQALSPLVRGAGNEQAVDYPGPGGEEVDVVVAQGDTGADIAATLRDADVIRTSEAFLKAAQVEPDAAGIQPGTYTLRTQMRAAGALEVLVDPENRVVGRATVREGLWASEVYATLSESTGIPLADYTAAAKDTKALGLPDSAKGNLEGYLFPSTYEFDEKTPAAEQLAAMVAMTVGELEAAGVDPDDYERIITVASIIEGEARGDADRGKVARVVENRIEAPDGPTGGRLEMDSTVNYALQKRGSLTRPEFDKAKTSPYDTYAVAGLPPGPIGNPGAAAIEAAADPTPGPWFYFVTVNLDSGETLFAADFDEHQQNVQKYETWCDDNPGVC